MEFRKLHDYLSLDGGTNHTSNPNNYTIEDSLVLEKPTKENKEFLGEIQKGLFDLGRQFPAPGGSS